MMHHFDSIFVPVAIEEPMRLPVDIGIIVNLVFKALTTFSTILATYFLASPSALPWRAKMAANAMMGMSVVQVSGYSFEDLFVVTFFNMFIKKPTCFYVNLFL